MFDLEMNFITMLVIAVLITLILFALSEFLAASRKKERVHRDDEFDELALVDDGLKNTIDDNVEEVSESRNDSVEELKMITKDFIVSYVNILLYMRKTSDRVAYVDGKYYRKVGDEFLEIPIDLHKNDFVIMAMLEQDIVELSLAKSAGHSLSIEDLQFINDFGGEIIEDSISLFISGEDFEVKLPRQKASPAAAETSLDTDTSNLVTKEELDDKLSQVSVNDESDLVEELENLRDEVNDLMDSMDSRFEKILKRLDALDPKVDELETLVHQYKDEVKETSSSAKKEKKSEPKVDKKEKVKKSSKPKVKKEKPKSDEAKKDIDKKKEVEDKQESKDLELEKVKDEKPEPKEEPQEEAKKEVKEEPKASRKRDEPNRPEGLDEEDLAEVEGALLEWEEEQIDISDYIDQDELEEMNNELEDELSDVDFGDIESFSIG